MAEQTEGFSFAYLKELMLSSVMAWVRRPAAGAMDAVMAAQVELLREQVKAPRAPEVAIGPSTSVGFIPRPAATRG